VKDISNVMLYNTQSSCSAKLLRDICISNNIMSALKADLSTDCFLITISPFSFSVLTGRTKTY